EGWCCLACWSRVSPHFPSIGAYLPVTRSGTSHAQCTDGDQHHGDQQQEPPPARRGSAPRLLPLPLGTGKLSLASPPARHRVSYGLAPNQASSRFGQSRQ